MRIGPVRVEEVDGGRLRRSALLEWSEGAYDLWFEGPAGIAEDSEDASAWLCAALPLAMRISEPVDLAGAVSERLLEGCQEIQAIYDAWEAAATKVTITAPLTPTAVRREESRRAAAFFSRGVDSLFTAARDRVGPTDLDVLVFGDRLEPRHDETVRAEEIRRAEAAAFDLGIPLVVAETSVRALTDSFGADWEDVLAAGLSFLAHGMAAGIASIVIPSTDNYSTIDPCGSSPLLDSLFSTDSLAVVHDTIAFSRLDKVLWLAAKTPELLVHLKVCARENRPDNCGYCGKCVYTMMCLEVAGALGKASQFPSSLDPSVVAGLRAPHLKARRDYAEVAGALGTTPSERLLKEAIEESLRASALSNELSAAKGLPWTPRSVMRDHRWNETLALALSGELPAGPATSGTAAHWRTLAFEAGGVAVHAAEVTAGLGRFTTMPVPGGVPFWLIDGVLLTRGMQPPRPSVLAATTAAIASRAPGDLARAVRARLRRNSPTLLSSAPAGYLHLAGAPGRVPLYGAWEAATGKQLLSRKTGTLLGWLDALT